MFKVGDLVVRKDKDKDDLWTNPNYKPKDIHGEFIILEITSLGCLKFKETGNFSWSSVKFELCSLPAKPIEEYL